MNHQSGLNNHQRINNHQISNSRRPLEKARSLARGGICRPLEGDRICCGRTPTSMCRFLCRRRRITRNCSRKLLATARERSLVVES